MLVNASQLNTDPVQYLVEALGMPRIGTGFLHGPPGLGKSLLLLDLLLAIGNPGHDFIGMPVVHGSGAWVLGEGHNDAGVRIATRVARQAADDWAAWLDAQLEDPPRSPVFAPYTDKRLLIETEPFACLIEKSGMTVDLALAVAKLATIPQLELVVLDGIANFIGPGASLSSVATAGKLVEGMKYMAEKLNCFVLAINNDNTDGTKMKGAGELADRVDMVMQVTRGYSYDMEKMVITMSCSKNKVGLIFEPFQFVTEASPGRLSATVRLAESRIAPVVMPAPVADQPKKRRGFLKLVERAEEHRDKRLA